MFEMTTWTGMCQHTGKNLAMTYVEIYILLMLLMRCWGPPKLSAFKSTFTQSTVSLVHHLARAQS